MPAPNCSHRNQINAPFFFAGTLKIADDLLLYREFVAFDRLK